MAENRRRQKWNLFWRQEGKCCYCSVPMVLSFHHIKEPPKNLATLEHHDDRFSPERGKHFGEYRRSLACWQCNFERGKASQAQQPIEELRRRAQNGRTSSIYTIGNSAAGQSTLGKSDG